MNTRLFFLLAFSFLLTGCSISGIFAGAGATAGVSASQEGGLSRAWSDAKIQAQINDLWFRYDIEAFRKLDMTVSQGRVLITGVVQNPEHRVEAVRLAWQPDGVEQVINEVRVAESEGILGFARDSWISGRLRAALTFDRDVLSINYNIDTVQGTVYLMGFAQNQAELNRVIETARTIPDVRQVVSYVKLVGEQSQNYVPDNNGPQDYQQPAYEQPEYVQPAYEPPDNISNSAPQPLTRQDMSTGPANTPAPVQREEVEWN